MGLTQVSTDGVKNDAITKTKIPANQIEASELADNAVDTNAIANNAVTAGKLASGVQTTINNNAANRVITGSGTANTLEGEANATFNGDSLGLNSSSTTEINLQTSNNTRFKIQAGSNFAQFLTQNNNSLEFKHDGGTGSGTQIFSMNSSGLDIGNNKRIHIKDYYGDVSGRIENSDSTNNSLRIDADPDNTSSGTGTVLLFRTDGVNRGSFTANGLCFGSDTAAASALDDYEEGTWTPTYQNNDNSPTFSVQTGRYTKVGRFVYCTGRLNVAGGTGLATNDGSGVNIGGLPFVGNNDHHACLLTLGRFVSILQDGGASVNTVRFNGDSIMLMTANGNEVTYTECNSFGDMTFAISYQQ